MEVEMRCRIKIRAAEKLWRHSTDAASKTFSTEV